jgi:hypothetical protein
MSSGLAVAVASFEQAKPPQPGRASMHFPAKSATSCRHRTCEESGREEAAMRALTTVALLAAMAPALGASSPARNSFAVQAELQSLYDEDSAAALQFFTAQDIDDFHGILCTKDWFFLDAAGQRHPWSEMRDQAAKLLTEPRAISISQPISKISLTGNGAVAVVTVTTVRGVVDDEGRYGRKGARHVLTESTRYKDTWVQAEDEWKQQSREQMGRASQRVDEPAS